MIVQIRFRASNVTLLKAFVKKKSSNIINFMEQTNSSSSFKVWHPRCVLITVYKERVKVKHNY